MNVKSLESQDPPLILIVDDVPINLQVLTSLLSDEDYEIAAATSGEEALFLLNTILPDLILLDVIMPDMDGFEVCEMIKASPRTEDIPIIFLTAKTEAEYIVRGFQMGAVDYVRKPFNTPELLARVHTHLELKRARDTQQKLIEKLHEKTEETARASKIVKAVNKNITESIQYAKIIQKSLLPNPENISSFLPDSFFIWNPRDIVGGDFIFMDCLEDGIILAVIDCTGHGVPGAFMTIIASFGLRKIIREGWHDPAQILRRLSFLVKTTLQQDTDYALSDDGLDAAICFASNYDPSTKKSHPYYSTLTFAGARLPLYYTHNNKISVIRGDKQSIGYKRSDLNFRFTNHTVHIGPEMSFYMATDGFTDQPGGKIRLRFGTRRMKNLLKEIEGRPFEEQRTALLEAFNEYKGGNEIRDDVTVVGFGFNA